MRKLRARAKVTPITPHLATAEMLVATLVCLALCGSWLAVVLPAEHATTTMDGLGRLILTPVKDVLYYAAHGLAIASVITAGLMAGLMGGFRTLTIGVRIALLVLVTLALVWAGLSYTTAELLSPSIVGATGPFVWLTLVFVMAGTDRRIWHYMDRIIPLLAYASSLMALRALLFFSFSLYNGFSRYTLYASLLTWLGGWTLLTATRFSGLRLFVRVIPYAMLMIMAVCAQSRSWTLQGLLLGVSFILLRARERGSLLSAVRLLALGSLLCGLTVAVLYVTIPATINASVDGFSRRIDQDSRSGQYTAFFNSVPAGDLIFGRGPKATWYWPGFGDYQFFDNGYLWTLFIGGIPVLMCYFAIMIWPALRALRELPRGNDAAAVCLTLMWGLALTGLSTFCLPSVMMSNFVLALMAGRCHLMLAESHRKAAVTGRLRLLVNRQSRVAPRLFAETISHP